jgi:hypothetical protein
MRVMANGGRSEHRTSTILFWPRTREEFTIAACGFGAGEGVGVAASRSTHLRACRVEVLSPSDLRPGARPQGQRLAARTGTMAGRLRVKRLPGVLDRYRRWDIVLDGGVAGAVANGQTSDVFVECGTHTVRVGHRWWASPIRTFTVTDSKTVEFVCRPRPHPMIWMAYGVASLYRHDLFIVLEPIPLRASESIPRHASPDEAHVP